MTHTQSPHVVRTETVYQLTATECGAAALGIVLGHYGRRVPLQTLREECGVGRDGATAKGIRNGAEAEGLTFELHQTAAVSAVDLPTPFIAFWRRRHFLVVEGHNRHGWHLNDPARGRYVVSDDEWAEHYSNYAIVLAPGPGFKRTTDDRRPYYRELLWPMRGSWWPLLIVMFTGVLLIVPSVLMPLIAGVFIDDIVIKNNGRLLGPILVALLLIGLYSATMRVLDLWTMLHLSAPLHARLSGGVLWRMLRLPTDFFAMRPVGGLMTRIGKADSIADLSLHAMPKVILSALTMIAMLAVVLWRSPLLAAVAVVSAVTTVASLALVARVRREQPQKLQAGKFELSGKAMAGLRDMDSLKAQGASRQYLDSFMGNQAELLATSQRLRRIGAYYAVVPGTIKTLTSMSLLIVGALEVMAGRLTVGAVVACLMLTSRFLAPVGSFLGVGQQLQTTHATVSQLNDILDTPLDPEFATADDPGQAVSFRRKRDAASDPAAPGQGPEQGPAPAPGQGQGQGPGQGPASGQGRPDVVELSGQVSLTDVTFGYSRSTPVLKGINLAIPAGAKVGIVGRSGSGKSTLGNLICGVVHPWSGTVSFDAIDRAQLRRSLLTTSIAKVNQAPVMFEGTVDDNVRMWDPTIPTEAVAQALEAARCVPFLAARGGAQAPVLAEGRNFSGGQVQRLEIARALARRPAIVVLDEATSALDTHNERAIDEAVAAFGCTRIIIAHRLSTVADCDVIYVLDRGAIIEHGTPAELLAAGGRYAEMLGSER
jgi:ABC-type bacteriocin/lantibiotic exporter with double-glycine peptidase domain